MKIRNVIQTLYDQTIRPYLPRKLGLLNGVVVRRPRLLDVTDHDPQFKAAFVDSLREQITEGDIVIIVGGGAGVAMVVAARHVGETGRVICYEGGKQYVERCRETAELNDISEYATVEHTIVGEDVNVWGDPGTIIPPSELPYCDVLAMDCEGAEWSILQGLSQRPRVLVVEVHPQHDVAVSDVEDLLVEWGYQTEVGENPKGYHQKEGKPVVIGVMDN